MTRGGSWTRPGAVYHVISRFVGREWFIKSSVERKGYLMLLGDVLGRSNWRCFCYAVMSNHVHLGMVAGHQPLAGWMRPMHTEFAKWLNARLERVGAIFVRGPKVIEVRTEGAARLINYVHYNPVRAGVVAQPGASDWTSHRAYVGSGHRYRWLDVDCGVELVRRTNALATSTPEALASWLEAAHVGREELDARERTVDRTEITVLMTA